MTVGKEQAEQEAIPPGPGELPREPGDLRQLQEWVALLADSARTLFKLMQAEFALTLATIPRIVVMSVVLLPFLLLAWISLCVLMAWFAWEWSGELGLGLFVFFVLQVIPSVLLALKLVRLQKDLFFPATKRQLRKFSEFMEGE